MLDEIKTPKELIKYIKDNIKYGFISSLDKKIFIRKEINNDQLYDEFIFKYYYLQTPEELLKNKVGLCYDQVELMRYWFIKNKYQVYTYYSSFHHHSILIYSDNNKYYLIETTIPRFTGIYEFSTINECLIFYKKMQEKLKKEKIDNFKIYKYDKVRFNSNFFEEVYYNCKEKEADIIL